MSKVFVGLSGGVDSSVAAYILQQQGYEVEAMFMQNWHNTTGTLHGDCPWKDDLALAQLVAKQLGIPFHSIDLSDAYRRRVVDYMFAEYARGRTPNPDVLCNREIKFDAFLEACMVQGAAMVATGHYCRKSEETIDGKPMYNLIAGADGNKDQSYFLCQLSQQQLQHALFPIGEMTKPEVREVARSLHLPTATRKDSQGICFVGKVDLPVFLQQKLKAQAGDIIEIPKEYKPCSDTSNLWAMAQPYTLSPAMGKKIGTHQGAHFYTIGQRRGFGVGGHREPLFVLATDVKKNIVYVGEGHAHNCLNHNALHINSEEQHWLRPDKILQVGEQRTYKVRIRYRQPLQNATLHALPQGIVIVFDQPQRGITPGQLAGCRASVVGTQGAVACQG
ncbi:tRNA-specific 2-thiouridylase MnmA [Bacteroidia bacterium]|nr:tRNA-specific 2-thiouridylase MnmA [Bacteroidia bacterium]